MSGFKEFRGWLLTKLEVDELGFDKWLVKVSSEELLRCFEEYLGEVKKLGEEVDAHD